MAAIYESLGYEEVRHLWSGADKIESMVQALETKAGLPPIIIVPGARYPNSPESSFIDGVHRGIASMIYILRTQQEPFMDILSGEKKDVVARALNKVLSVFRS